MNLARMIPIFSKGDCFEIWNEIILTFLNYLEVDLAMDSDVPKPLSQFSTPEEVAYVRAWERSNLRCLNIIKQFVSGNFKDFHSGRIDSARWYLVYMARRCGITDKSKIAKLLSSLTNSKYYGIGFLGEHFLGMREEADCLKELGFIVAEDQLVHLGLLSLPPYFEEFRKGYYLLEESWTLGELSKKSVVEEERLMQRGEIQAAIAEGLSQESSASNTIKKRKRSVVAHSVPQEKPKGCHFCGNSNHVKGDCRFYHEYRAKKGTLPSPAVF